MKENPFVMRNLLLAMLLALLWGCVSLRNRVEISEIDDCRKDPIRELIAQALCERFPDIWETVRCPDSTHFYPLPDSLSLLSHSFFGSGYGNGMIVHLWDISGGTAEVFDSISLCIPNDIKPLPTLVFNDSLNWFVALERGDGTGHFSETAHYIRIEDRKLNVLLTLPLYVSDIDPESSLFSVYVLQVQVLEETQSKIIVKADVTRRVTTSWDEGEGEDDADVFTEEIRHAEDVALFVYDESDKRFIWQSSSNALFVPFWADSIHYSFIVGSFENDDF